jgi:hypothetical protein
MRILYLDQNKWIEFAKAAKAPEHDADTYALLEEVDAEVRAGRLAVPLTATNVYETHKINIPQRRDDLAAIQSALSRGLVIRGRHKRLEVEFSAAMRPAYGLEPIKLDPFWFLSDIFFEAVAEWHDPRLGLDISEKGITNIRARPAHWLYLYLTQTPEAVRLAGVKNFTDGSEKLRKKIEERRQRHSSESLSMRRKIQSAMLMINEIDLLLAFAAKAEIPWNSVSDIGRKNALRIMDEMPTFYIEREIAVRIEAQDRPIEENDFRDMQTFCAVVRYADMVVAENMFSSLARQAKLDQKYNTQIATDLSAIRTWLSAA